MAHIQTCAKYEVRADTYIEHNFEINMLTSIIILKNQIIIEYNEIYLCQTLTYVGL
jgi:hypothetical protein